MCPATSDPKRGGKESPTGSPLVQKHGTAGAHRGSTRAAAAIVLQQKSSSSVGGSSSSTGSRPATRPTVKKGASSSSLQPSKPTARGSLYGLCLFDPPKGQRVKKKPEEVQDLVLEEEPPQPEPTPAPLDLIAVLLPVLHCLGSNPLEGVPQWTALGCASKSIRFALREACCENPVLLHEWRVLGQRAEGLNVVLREYFRDLSRWRRHDLKGKTHELKSTIVRPRCSILGAPCHVLALSPVKPPEEFVLDMERHRQLVRVEFSWCAEPGTSATLQLCKFLKQKEASPPVASVALASDPHRSNNWQCVRLELDWSRRVFRWSVEANPGSASVLGSSSENIKVSEEQKFAHDVCDGVRYLKVTELRGRLAFAHLQAFA